jgi:hypothetical protein
MYELSLASVRKDAKVIRKVANLFFLVIPKITNAFFFCHTQVLMVARNCPQAASASKPRE